jgi:general secretion pathway protein G
MSVFRDSTFGRRGFTLIEVLLVIVIIGVLSGMVVTQLSGRSHEARITRANADMKGHLSLALDMFEQDTGRYPTSEEGLSALVVNPGVSGWKGPYLKAGLYKDPWDNDYRYTLDPNDPRQYRLTSLGPDGQAGTEDDVVFGLIEQGNLY